jgi:hypothetical protein
MIEMIKIFIMAVLEQQAMSLHILTTGKAER